MKIFLRLIFWIGGCAISVASAQTTMTLQQALDIAVQQNIGVKESNATLQIAKNGVQQSKLQLLPNLNGQAVYYINYGKSLDPVTSTFVTQNIQSNSFTLTSSLNLFSGGRINATIRKAESDYEAARLGTQSLIDDTKLQVILAYLNILYAEEELKAAQKKIEISRTQLSNSQKLANAGNIPEGNLLSIEAQVATDTLNIINAQNLVNTDYLNLKLLLQMKPDENFTIVFPEVATFEQILAAPVPDVNTVIQTAEQTQPGIKKYEYLMNSDQLGIKIAGSYGLPALSAIGELSTSYSNATYPPIYPVADPYGDQISNNLGEVVGLSLSIPLFNNGNVILSRQNAQVQYLSTQLEQETAINTLRQNVVKAVNDLIAAEASYEAASKSYEASKLAFEFVEKKFNLGSASSLDYTTAINTMAQSEVTLIQAKYDLIFKSKYVDYYLNKPLDL